MYFKQSELLLRILPIVGRYNAFALKGGTAINFFIQNMPRLSIDIDLTYVILDSRNDALRNISDSLESIAEDIKRIFPDVKILFKKMANSNYTSSLVVDKSGVVIKIEVNTVIRGTLLPVTKMGLVKAAVDKFNLGIFTNILNPDELYAGKICAALDRQHPRDLFDIFLFFTNNIITEKVKDCFIFYLVSHNRPIIELLNPNRIDIEDIYEKEFTGMTSIVVPLEELISIRDRLIENINLSLNKRDKEFLLSIMKSNPEWDKYLYKISEYPSIKWKLFNISKMDEMKREKEYLSLKNYLQI